MITRASRSFTIGLAGDNSLARFTSASPSANLHSEKKRTQPKAACASARFGPTATAFSAKPKGEEDGAGLVDPAGALQVLVGAKTSETVPSSFGAGVN